MPIPVLLQFEDGTEQLIKTDHIRRMPEVSCTSQSPLKAILLDPEHLLPLFDEPYVLSEEDNITIVGNLPYTDVGDDANIPYEWAVSIDLTDSGIWFQLGIRMYDSGYLQQIPNLIG